jgi:large subunit ribosomal protein L1
MPNPKVGTVTFDVSRAVAEMKAGRVEFRVDKAGIIHAPIGRRSFDTDKLVGNFIALIEVLQRHKPSTAKGVYMRAASLSTTMGPGIRLDPSQLANVEASH